MTETPPLNSPTVFAQEGWERIARKLATQSTEALKEALQKPTVLEGALLAGEDTKKFCAQLGSFGNGSNQIDVPVELVEAREVAAAIAPYLPALASTILNSPGPEEALNDVHRVVEQVVSDDRLAAEIDLFSQDLSSGALPVLKPGDWSTSEPWPPSSARLTALASTLRHASADSFKICSANATQAKSPKDLEANRSVAKLIATQVESWAKGCALPVANVVAPPVPTPQKVAPRVVPPADDQVSASPDRAKLAFIPFADDGSRYSVELQAVISNDASNTKFTVQWPLGITINHVTVVDDHLVIGTDPMLPNIPVVDVKALVETLRKLGLPNGVSVVDAQLIGVDQTLQNMSLSLYVVLGKLYTKTITLDLMKNGTSVAVEPQFVTIEKILLADVSAELQRSLPPLHFESSDFAVTVGAVEVDMIGGNAVIHGVMRLPLGGFTLNGGGSTVETSVTLSIPFADPTHPKLIEAHWPDGVLEDAKRQFLSKLPSIDIAASQCLGVTGLSLTQLPNGNLGLSATITQDGETVTSVSLDTSNPFGAIADQIGVLVKGKPVQECIARQVLAMTNAAASDAVNALKTKTVSVAGQQFSFQNVTFTNSAGKVLLKADLVSTADESLRIIGISIDGKWKVGEDLPLASISVEGVSLPASTVKRLLAVLNPTLAEWTSIRQIAFAKGKLTVRLRRRPPCGRMAR
ncbi:hypothetical protein RQ479_21145 [Mesorhizobium sp. ISC25]|uniref:hypothetical protein n=1 Tax=Mesorhizobium sp. ISC25 TaxID=3077335 RepID=UPI0035D6C97C